MEHTMQIGLVGLVGAGLALATPLMRNFAVVGYDRSEERRQLAASAGVQVAASSAEISKACEIVLLSLPLPAASLSAAAELMQGDMRGRLVIETSTVGPHDVENLQAAVAGSGATVVDSAIVGGVHKLTEGRTTFLVGASPADFGRAKAVLDWAAEEIFHLGDTGRDRKSVV